MCNCYEETRENVTDKIVEKIKTEVVFQKVESSDFVNKIWLLLNDDLAQSKSKAPITIPFEVKYTRKAKSSGTIREYKKQISLIPSYCSICGEGYSK